MKFLLSFLLVAGPCFAFAQTKNQSIPLDGISAVHIYAAFSSVHVSSGGTDALEVDHTFTVNGDDRPDLRRLTVERIDGVLHLREIKPTAKLLNREFPDKNGGMISGGREGGKGVFNGVTVDALLTVVVPRGIPVTVETKYGGIEVINVESLRSARAEYGPVKAVFTTVNPLAGIELYSNYGAVDITIPSGMGSDLELITKFGELLTNMDVRVDDRRSEEKDYFHRLVGSVGGGGKTIKCTAPYGDVLLREK